MSTPIRRFSFYALLLSALLACSREAPPPVDLRVKPVDQQKELVVLTQTAPNTFYVDSDGNYAGLEYDLIRLFAQQQGVPVRFVLLPNRQQTYKELAGEHAHLAAAGLAVATPAPKDVVFGPAYLLITPVVAYNINQPKPEDLADLAGKKVLIPSGSSHLPLLENAKPKLPDLEWQEEPYNDPAELLEKLARGEADYVVTDSTIVDVMRNFHPNINTAFELSPPRQVAWAIPEKAPDHFKQSVDAFFVQIEKDGTLRRLIDRYFGHLRRLNPIDVQTMLEARGSKLSEYRRYFEEAELLTGIDWRLLAALGYQESHWDPLATSPFGVRGLMMLTTATAERLGIKNRLDPRESILGGARYLQMLREMLPARIAEPDRTWIALATYNIGYGHLEDARILAKRQNKNPDAWTDLKSTLPQLRDEAYFTTVKNGYARGGETVIFVENVRTYRDILVRFEPPFRPLFPAFNDKVTVSDALKPDTAK
ncbi:membrane-bound lytic murein transglycosylase F [Chitinivorax tropicus]|uniref:Membrane-bound lytic murein transglycosylase F n=1 Tax=Chitinivorax tropicus TaxID=714531 RepID=A0A840MRJ7_9PROT|nr:membrane-bound lytic murein transglycosylase MltF [Chitinivorax tropicus]MBB5020045.1 membrane-bound lytic murein transglycosylase F [Chitinivorax tropicus]